MSQKRCIIFITKLCGKKKNAHKNFVPSAVYSMFCFRNCNNFYNVRARANKVVLVCYCVRKLFTVVLNTNTAAFPCSHLFTTNIIELTTSLIRIAPTFRNTQYQLIFLRRFSFSRPILKLFTRNSVCRCFGQTFRFDNLESAYKILSTGNIPLNLFFIRVSYLVLKFFSYRSSLIVNA